MTGILKPEWVNSAEKWLKPLLTARAEENRRAYGIGGNLAPAESIRQACVWSLHLHQTRWENALDYTAAYDALVAEVKARRRRSLADRARTRKPPPVPTNRLPILELTPRKPTVWLPILPPTIRDAANPEDAIPPRQRGPAFQDPQAPGEYRTRSRLPGGRALPPAAPFADTGLPSSPEVCLPTPPAKLRETPVETAWVQTDRGIPRGRGQGHFQAGRWWTSKQAAADYLALPHAPLPRARINRGLRTAARRVQTGAVDPVDMMGRIARLSRELNAKRLV